MVTKFLITLLVYALLANPLVYSREIRSAEEALRLGDVALSNGLSEKGRTYYMRAAELKPKDASPVIRLALLEYESSNYGSARKFLEAARSLRKDKQTQKISNSLLHKMNEADVVLIQIETAISSRDEKALVEGHAKAVEIMSRAPILMAILAPHLKYLLKKDPDDRRLLAALAEGYYHSSDSAKAYTYYKKLVEILSPRLTLYRRYGDVAVNVGAFDDARWAYKKALRQAVYHRDRVSAAELEKIVRKLPLFSDKIDEHIKNKDHSEAFKELRKYLSRNGSHPWAVLQMARLYEEMGRLGQAEKLYRQALEWRPEDPSAHFAMANYYLYHKKEFEKALGEYRLARALLAEEAQLSVDEKIQKKINENILAATRAIVYIYMEVLGRPKSAVSELEQLKKTGNAEARDYMSLGVAYARLKKRTSAYQALKKVMEMDPKSEAAKDAEALIETIRSESKKGFQLEAGT